MPSRFSLLYLDRSEPVQDSPRFRMRLYAYFSEHLDFLGGQFVQVIKKELGVEVPVSFGEYAFEKFFTHSETRDILDTITLVGDLLGHGSTFYDAWLEFVRRVLREENLSYTIDDEAVVHYSVDEEFERNRVSLLSALEDGRYTGVRAAFEDAHRHLDSDPMDTKAAVRSMFESIEILARLMVDTNNLNKWVVKNKLKPIAQRAYSNDEVAIETINTMFDGIGDWVHALHNYRHGQGSEQPVTPPIEFAVYVLSSGASLLRWLVELDKMTNET